MSTHPQQLPSKSSLSITLTEPFVVLRTVDTAGSDPALGEFAPPSVLRGLLALDLSKASKISSIQIELQATSCASWSEGMSRACSFLEPLQMVLGLGTSEERKLHSAAQVFFRAASSPSSRRSLSVEPGLSHYAHDSEHQQSPHPPPPPEAEPALPVPSPVYLTGDASQRGRMRVRRRSSADHLVFQRDPVAHLNRPPAPSPLSFPPTSEEELYTPTSAHFAESPTASITSFPHPETLAPARELHPPKKLTILLNPFS